MILISSNTFSEVILSLFQDCVDNEAEMVSLRALCLDKLLESVHADKLPEAELELFGLPGGLQVDWYRTSW